MDCAGWCKDGSGLDPAYYDDCGVCSEGYSGNVANSNMDDCGVCFGNNDCSADADGDGVPDSQDECSEGYSGNVANSNMDDCGVCFGNNDCNDCLNDGDVNFDGTLNVLDVVLIVNEILEPSLDTGSCDFQSMDANLDG